MKNKKFKKRGVILAVLPIIFVAFFIWLYWGNTSVQTTQITVGSPKLPASFNGFKIVQVSDLHNAEFGDNQSKLLRAVKDASPNLIAVTGDLIDSFHTDVEKAMRFISGAVRIAPVYYVTGNHEARTGEYPKLEEQMTQAGVVILRDQSAVIEYGNDSIRLLGLDDPGFAMKEGMPGESAEIVDTKLKAMPDESGEYRILLSHRPEWIDLYAANHMDLVLSGHAHGGQVRLPFIGGLFAPNQGLFPQYTEGAHEVGQTKMVVSRGLGNSIVPLRINNRPELVCITLEQS